MKNFILIFMLLCFTVVFAQNDYTKIAISAEYGMHDVSDESAILLDDLSNHELKDGHHWGLNGRYNFNPKFGVGLNLAWDNIALQTITYKPVDLDYAHATVEGYVNMFQVLDIQNNVVTAIFHGGPGVSYMKTDNDYTETVGSVSGGVSVLFKMNKWLALKGDWTSTGNLSQLKTIDGEYEMTNQGVNSIVHNYSVGATFYFGKKDNNGNRKEHADWVIPQKVEPVINNYNSYPVTNLITKTERVEADFKYHNEFVFFKHDEDVIEKSELNAIYKVFRELFENPDYTVTLKAFASATNSSDEYNMELSERRFKSVRDKLVKMGIANERIKSEAYGKDYKYGDENIHDMARRVEMIVNR